VERHAKRRVGEDLRGLALGLIIVPDPTRQVVARRNRSLLPERDIDCSHRHNVR
jgi:hypothetical protein